MNLGLNSIFLSISCPIAGSKHSLNLNVVRGNAGMPVQLFKEKVI